MAEKKKLKDKTKIPQPEQSSKEYETIIQENEADGSTNSADIILKNQSDFQEENSQQEKKQDEQEEIKQNNQLQNNKNLTIEQRLEEGSKLKLLGNKQIEQKNYEEALKQYNQAIEIVHPTHFVESSENQKKTMIELINILLNNIGHCQMQLEQFKEAIINFNQILVSNPQNIKAHYRLAKSYKKLQNYQMADKHIQQTYQLASKQNQVWNDLLKEMEEISLLCNEEQINIQEEQKINIKNEEKNEIINSNINKDLLWVAVPTLLTSTVFTKYVLKLNIRNMEGVLVNTGFGGSILLALILKKPSLKFLFGVLGTGIIGSSLLKKVFFTRKNN